MAMPWCLGIRNTDTVNPILFVINLFRNLPETNWFTMTSFCNQEFMEYIIPKSFEDFLPRNFCGEILANLTKISHMWIKVGVRHAFHSSLMLMMIHKSLVDIYTDEQEQWQKEQLTNDSNILNSLIFVLWSGTSLSIFFRCWSTRLKRCFFLVQRAWTHLVAQWVITGGLGTTKSPTGWY